MSSHAQGGRAYAWFGGAKTLLLCGFVLGGIQANARWHYWLALVVFATWSFFLWRRERALGAEELDLDWEHGLVLLLELGCELFLAVFEGQGSSDPTLLFMLTGTFAGFLYRFWGALPVAMGYTVGFGLLVVSHGVGVRQFPALSGLDGAGLLTRWALSSGMGFSLSILTSFLAESLRNHRIALIGTSQALELARLDMDAVVNRITSGVLVFDDQLRLLYSNEAAAVHLPATLHPGKPMVELFEGQTWGQAVLEGCQLVLQGAIPWDLETKGRKGDSLLFQASGHWAKGKLRNLVLTLQDITHLRKMEAEVRSAERMATLGNVAAQIAHEIRNPLASISGSAQLLSAVEGMGEDDCSLLRLIQEESARLNRTLQEFLDFSRLKPPSIRKIALRPLLEDVRLFLLQRPEAHKEWMPTIRLECPQTLEVHSDRDLLLQILQNLALNALQAVPLERRPEIGLLAEVEKHGTIRISVLDNGIGMTETVLERAGEAFFTTKPTGNGLGLAVSRQMAASLGGELILRSAQGSGTTAQVVLRREPVGGGA
ncbi:MAG: hypothetical protein RL318_1796 [Fibrobacterota bacterium]